MKEEFSYFSSSEVFADLTAWLGDRDVVLTTFLEVIFRMISVFCKSVIETVL